MRDINKELEKFYNLLDALESDNQQPSSTASERDQLDANADREPIAGRADARQSQAQSTRLPSQPEGIGSAGDDRADERSTNFGVYSGRSLRTPNKTIESNEPIARHSENANGLESDPSDLSRSVSSAAPPARLQSTEAPLTEHREQAQRPQTESPLTEHRQQAQQPQTESPQAKQQQAQPQAKALPSPERALPPAAPPARPAATSVKASIQSIPNSVPRPSGPISNLPADLIPYSRSSQRQDPIYNRAPAQDNQSQLGTPSARSAQEPGRAAQSRPVIARPATRPAQNRPLSDPAAERRSLPATPPARTARPIASEPPRAARPSPADIKPAGPPSTSEKREANARPEASAEEAWIRKVKLPNGGEQEPARHTAQRELDDVVSEVKVGLNKRGTRERTPSQMPTESYIPTTKFSPDRPESHSYKETRREIPPELLELPADEVPAKSRFTIAAAAIALVVPTVLAGVLIFNMSGNPESVEMVASSTLENGKAVLSMSTDPQGARVYLNNNLVGVTPFSGVKVDPGDYVVTTEKEGFIQADTVMRITGSERIAFNLNRIDGDVLGMPVGGHILSGLISEDEEGAGENGSAGDLDELDSELQELATERGAPADRAGNENDRSGTTDSRNAALANDRPPLYESNQQADEPVKKEEARPRKRVQTGALVLTSDPAGATVWVNDEVRGETPLTLNELNIGSYEVQLTKSGYDTYVADLDVSPSMATPYHGTLTPVLGTVAVRINGTADIYIDGQKLGNGVSGLGRFELAPGEHSIRAVTADQGEVEKSVTIEPGKEAELTLNFDAATDQLLAEASKLFNSGEYEASKELYEKVLALDPQNALAAAKLKEVERLLSTMVDQELVDAIIEDGVYVVVDSAPELVGGLESLHKRVSFPEAAHRAGVKGRVYIQFVVDENGNPSDFSVTRGLPLGCNDAAIEAISKSKFKPGVFRGRNVKSRHTLFVNFNS